MKSFIKNNFIVLFIYFLALIIALFFLFNYEKVAIHIYLNQFVGNHLLNLFFYYVTYLGDGLIAPFLLLVILMFNVRIGVYSTLSFLSATISSQILKRFFFDDANRPSYTFNYFNDFPMKYVEGVDRYLHNSFPSGHATQAFSILMCLVFVTKNQNLKFLFFSIAMLTSLSRVYLSQHWLSDITAGSLIGVFFSILFYYFILHKNKFEKLDQPLHAFKKF